MRYLVSVSRVVLMMRRLRWTVEREVVERAVAEVVAREAVAREAAAMALTSTSTQA